jgi:radical SAM superfamily enzyme YgiQ (UPF0313 family)
MKKTSLVQLVRPPLDDWYMASTGQIEEQVSVPIGLCILAATLKNLKCEIEIIDGMSMQLDDLLQKINPYAEFVGVTDIYSCHLNTLKILGYSKKQGAQTIIGGPNVNFLAERLLANHPFIDFAVKGDGERALPMLVSREKLENIPNLVYRKGNKINANQVEEAPMNILFNLENILERKMIEAEKPFPISSIRGCIKAQKGRRCSFCSIVHGLKIMKPDLIWKQILELNNSYGLNYFFETGDSFVIPGFLKKLLYSRPSTLKKVSFRGYASPNQITNETGSMLTALNCREIFLGLESPIDAILKSANKGYLHKDILNAIKIADEFGINMQIPFMWGLPGQTQQNMLEQISFAKKLTETHPKLKITSSLAIPLPGTELFNYLMNDQVARKKYPGNLLTDSEFNYQELVKLNLEYRTGVSFNDTLKMVFATKNLAKQTTSFGININ